MFFRLVATWNGSVKSRKVRSLPKSLGGHVFSTYPDIRNADYSSSFAPLHQANRFIGSSVFGIHVKLLFGVSITKTC